MIYRTTMQNTPIFSEKFKNRTNTKLCNHQFHHVHLAFPNEYLEWKQIAKRQSMSL